MKLFYPAFSTFLLLAAANYVSGQNTGIGTDAPLAALHIASPQPEVLRMENTIPLAADVRNELLFKTGGYFTGGVRTTGLSSNYARLGFLTYSVTDSSLLKERLSIADNGYVGINQIDPTAMLEINGQIKITDGSQLANRVLTCDGDGLALWKAVPLPVLPASVSFGAAQLAGYNFPSGANTKIPFAQETYDTDGVFSGGTFTVPTTGVYHFDADVISTGVLLVSSGQARMELRVNNAVVRVVDAILTASQYFPSMNISCDLLLTAGYAVEVYLYQSNGTAASLTLGGSGTAARNPHFTGHKVY